MIEPLSTPTLPRGIRARFVDNINGLRMHVLEAGFEEKGRPCLLLLHGFPELAYSWRKVMVPLAAAGYHVVAPDLRGYGRTTGWDGDYDGDLGSFRMLNTVRDIVGLVSALGYRSVAGVVGHDYGSPVSGWCALVRPDVFRSVTLMSAPFPGPPSIPFDTADAPQDAPKTSPTIHDDLAALATPRKHYHWYYSTRPANADMTDCPQGIHAFLRAYYHHKSADWKANKPHKLEGWIATELAKMPTYYVMELDKTMPQSVAPHMPGAAEVAACTLPFTPPSTAGRDSRAACRTIACAPAAASRPSWKCSRAAPSTSHPASSPARAIGASTRRRACSSVCRARSARTCWPAIWSTAPATGCSRSSRRP
jgi:pimeloyl-ACP methyl ester carboxylesterase